MSGSSVATVIVHEATQEVREVRHGVSVRQQRNPQLPPSF
jgi:hypothetical protein